MAEPLTSISSRRNPKQVLRVFTVFSVLSVISILLLVSGGIYRILSSHIIREAEMNSMSVAYAIYEREQERLVSAGADGKQTFSISPEYLPELDLRMKRYLHPFNMYKIKLFDAGKRVVYSTDHSIVGRVDAKNELLARALKGEIASTILKKDGILDLEGEKRFNVDVVETYLPIINDDHEVIGSFEVYIDITRYKNEIKKVMLSLSLILSAVLFFVFGILFGLMSKSTKELTETQKELERMAKTDGLTGLFTRGYLITRAEEEFSKVVRHSDGRIIKNFLGFIMVDVDHFKDINDRYGHLVGDEILRNLSSLIRSSIRVYDFVGRYGGEEFLVVLPNTDFEETLTIAQRILRMVRETPFTVPGGQTITITVSLGISCVSGSDKDMDAALKKADDGLYKAKNSGRDQVAWIA